MAGRNELWWKQPKLWVEAFASVNLGFLTFDIYLAHSVNQFRNRAEYVPLFFYSFRRSRLYCYCSLSGCRNVGLGLRRSSGI